MKNLILTTMLALGLMNPALAADIKLKSNLVTPKNVTIQSPGVLTLGVGLTSANIGTGSAKRQVVRVLLSPNTGAAADSTVYSGLIFFGRAGTVKRITFGAAVPPVGGTDTLKALKGSSSGNTMLNAASLDATTLVANTATNATLTSTTADLGLTATQPVYLEYSAGVQSTDAQEVSGTVEFEPTDF